MRSRRPPQSNCPAAAVPAPDNGARLETESEKGGISTVPPPSPQGRHQRLPPILRITDPIPTTAYSKAPRCLFVLPRVGRIFTASSISPSPSLRQRSSRYAIRAGRNLPDKEFRLMLLLRLGGRWRGHFCRTLHIAMQSGPSLYSMSRASGVWSLRIPISSVLDLRRFIVSAI